MKRLTGLLLAATLILITDSLYGQSYAYGIKAGLTAGSQTWNNRSRRNGILFRYHAAAYIESHENETDRYSLFSQLGYHVRGSAVRFNGGVNIDNQYIPAQTLALEFRNLALIAGAKQKFSMGENKVYYLLGLRGEYTTGFDLEIYRGFEGGVRRWNYGVTLGGGFQWNFTELVGAIIELQVHPDLSRQVYIPPQWWIHPFTGQRDQLQEQNIRNFSIELSVGFRLLRKIEYIEDDAFSYIN